MKGGVAHAVELRENDGVAWDMVRTVVHLVVEVEIGKFSIPPYCFGFHHVGVNDVRALLWTLHRGYPVGLPG